MADIKTYNEYLATINLKKLCKEYKIIGDYGRTTQILNWVRKKTKAWEYKMQSALLDYHDDQFILLNKIMKKDDLSK